MMTNEAVKTAQAIKDAQFHVKVLRRYVYEILADQLKEEARKGAVIPAKTFDGYMELTQAVELIDNYLFIIGQQPRYKVRDDD